MKLTSLLPGLFLVLALGLAACAGLPSNAAGLPSDTPSVSTAFEAPTATVGTTVTSTSLPTAASLDVTNLIVTPTLGPTLAPTATAAAQVAIIACKTPAALTPAVTANHYPHLLRVLGDERQDTCK